MFSETSWYFMYEFHAILFFSLSKCLFSSVGFSAAIKTFLANSKKKQEAFLVYILPNSIETFDVFCSEVVFSTK